MVKRVRRMSKRSWLAMTQTEQHELYNLMVDMLNEVREFLHTVETEYGIIPPKEGKHD